MSLYLLLQFKHRMNLTASGPRPNPQGSYHYGLIKVQQTIVLANSAAHINGRQRYAINSVSYAQADTPLKLADYFNIQGVYYPNSMPSYPTGRPAYQQTAVLQTNYRSFIEIVFQNQEDYVQSYHIDGYAFFVVGYVQNSILISKSSELNTEHTKTG